MVNIFQALKYDDTLTIDDYNQTTRDVFFNYFQNEKIYLQSKELLRAELVNYVNYILHKDKFEKLFASILKVFQEAIHKNYSQVIKELAKDLAKINETDELYMSYYINQPKDISSFAPRDFATYYFKTIDDLLEGCFKPRLEVFYKVYKFNLDDSFPDTSNKTFGDIVNLIKDFDDLTKDPQFNISISQWRNISAHKDFKISKDSINVEYGKKENKKSQSLTHQQLRELTFWTNTVYGVLRLAEVIVYLNYSEEIIETDEYKDTQINLRSESFLLHIIHNLQTVGFKFHSFNEIENIFELNLYIKANKNVRESIIHATQAFVQIAMALNEDEFQKGKFEFIQINILDHSEKVLSSAKIDIQFPIKYLYGQINIEDFSKKIEFRGI